MATVEVYFNDTLQDRIGLKPGVTSIGRDPGNDIPIDNLGASTLHARIVQEGDAFCIEDTGSQNGTFVNGERVTRQRLKDGDVIAIFKHTLKFRSTAWAEQPSADSPPRPATPSADSGATVVADLTQVREMLRRQRADASVVRGEATARLIVLDAGSRSPAYSLSVHPFLIGKKKDADLRLRGWFAPQVAAVVLRKPDGYYLSPWPGGRVRLNGRRVARAQRLTDGDSLRVRGLDLKFFVSVPEPARAKAAHGSTSLE